MTTEHRAVFDEVMAHQRAQHDVNIKQRQGKIYFLDGEGGSGKTTSRTCCSHKQGGMARSVSLWRRLG